MNVIQPLIDLQETDGRIRALEQEKKDIPQRQAQENARLAGVNMALDIAKKQLAAMQQRIREDEAEAAEARAKAQELQIGTASIQSTRELQQVNIQIETLRQKAEEADNRNVALLEQIPELEKNVAEAQAKVDAEKGGVDGYVEDLGARLQEVEAELAALRVEREQKKALVTNPRHLLYYERQSTKRWPVVVTLSPEGVCDGCHLVQPPSVAQMVQHNQDLVACTMCGRILYRDL